MLANPSMTPRMSFSRSHRDTCRTRGVSAPRPAPPRISAPPGGMPEPSCLVDVCGFVLVHGPRSKPSLDRRCCTYRDVMRLFFCEKGSIDGMITVTLLGSAHAGA